MTEVPGGPNGKPEPAADLAAKSTAGFGRPPKPDLARYFKIFVWVVLVGYVALFLLRNSQQTTVDFVILSTSAPQFVALLLAVVLGFLIGVTMMWINARRRRRGQGSEAGKE